MAGNDRGAIQGILQPTNGSKLCVAVCQDGRTPLWAGPVYANNFKFHLEKLFEAWGCQDVSLELNDFSCMSKDATRMLQLLVDSTSS